MSRIIYKGKPLTGSGIEVRQMTRAEYERDKSSLDNANLIIEITDEDLEPINADDIAYGEGTVEDAITQINNDLSAKNVGITLASGVTLISNNSKSKCGIVTINVVATKTLVLNSWNTLFTINSEFKPSHTINLPAVNMTKDIFINCVCKSDGRVEVYPISPNTATLSNIGINISYINN